MFVSTGESSTAVVGDIVANRTGVCERLSIDSEIAGVACGEVGDFVWQQIDSGSTVVFASEPEADSEFLVSLQLYPSSYPTRLLRFPSDAGSHLGFVRA